MPAVSEVEVEADVTYDRVLSLSSCGSAQRSALAPTTVLYKLWGLESIWGGGDLSLSLSHTHTLCPNADT